MLLNVYLISNVGDNPIGICVTIISTEAFTRLCMEEILMLGNSFMSVALPIIKVNQPTFYCYLFG